MKKNTLTTLAALPFMAIAGLNSAAYAMEENPPAEDKDSSTFTLEAMTISSEQPQEAFESIKLIKKDLGIATDGADVLKQTPGVSVTRQGGTASDPILRGLGGTRLNISIDGVPFGGVCNHRMDPATAYISPGSFDSLIILKGPQSVKNGNNISGAVNFDREEIRYEEVGARAYGSYLYGSFNQQALSVDSSVGFEKGYLAYTHNNTSGDNYTDGDGNTIAQTFYDTSNDRGAIGYTPDADTLLEFSGLRSDGVIGNATIHMDVTKLDRQNYNLHFKKENISSWLQKIDIRYNFTEVDHDMDNFTHRSPPPGDDYNLMQQFWQRNFAKVEIAADITPDLELISGIEYKHDSYDGKGGGGDPLFSPPPDTSNVPFNHLVDFDNVGIFTELDYQMSEGVRWVTGFRVDTLGTDTGTMHAAGEITDIIINGSNTHRRQTLFAGFLRAEYSAKELPIMFSAGYGHAERAPDYWEVYSMGGLPEYKQDENGEPILDENKNKILDVEANDKNASINLNREKNNEIDAVVSYQAENFSVELSAFYSHITDFIIVQDGDRALNVNAQRTGSELLLAYHFTDNFSVNGDISYVYAENLTDNTPLPQTPPLNGNIGLTYDDGVFYGAVNTRLAYKQDRIQPGFGNVLALDTTPTAGFVTASLKLGYTPHPLVKFQFGIDNIFDKTYSEHLNRSGGGFGGNPAVIKLPEPGRAYWGRVSIDFDYPPSFK